jgi:aryl-alcohol dehydrogenase-like predicted oxidoreductase
VPRTRHRIRAVLAAWSRVPHRNDPLARRPRRRRLAQDDPRFTDDNFQHNLQIADEVRAIAAESGATPAQVALAWLLTRGDDIAPIPGTKRVERVEENVAADDLVLTADQIAKLDNLTPPVGDHHNEAQMRLLER